MYCSLSEYVWELKINSPLWKTNNAGYSNKSNASTSLLTFLFMSASNSCFFVLNASVSVSSVSSTHADE